MEREEQQQDPEQQAADETPEEFAESIESDPAHNPDDEDLERLRGG
jgi:hypothetical protein